ncbi:MAG: SGNH/GDSL hydrolase family protein [Verrucomicrobia bacterium]|nr:SGNH/GDSL hydrolase family protein [Verrucomicrobiota bacterium]
MMSKEDMPIDALGRNGYRYPMPVFKKSSRMLFIGDSITEMNRWLNENDRNHYLGHSFVFLLASRLAVDMPEAQLDFYNRGISGNTVADLRNRWQEDAIDMNPDVLTVLIGVNDGGRDVSPEEYEADYHHILKRSRDANPDLKLILMDPFVLQSGSLSGKGAWNCWQAITAAYRKRVARLATEFDALHIPLQDLFDSAARIAPASHWLWDGMHPLPQGHELIARHWLMAVNARWGNEREVRQ